MGQTETIEQSSDQHLRIHMCVSDGTTNRKKKRENLHKIFSLSLSFFLRVFSFCTCGYLAFVGIGVDIYIYTDAYEENIVARSYSNCFHFFRNSQI